MKLKECKQLLKNMNSFTKLLSYKGADSSLKCGTLAKVTQINS